GARRSGVAARWRIRHKLLLGVCLVCGVLALLLAGTLRGLWSYYLTMNGIRGKEAELKVARKFLNEVYDLKVFKTTGAATGDDFFAPFAGLPGKTHQARDRLADYETQLQDTLAQGRDPSNGEHQLLTVQALKADLDRLDAATAAFFKPRMDSGGNGKVEKELHDEVRGQIDQLVTDADDLYTKINDDIDQHIDESREHYQVTLWIVVPASVVGLLVMAGLMRSFYGWIFNSIRDLQTGVRRVAGGDFTRPIEVKSG